MTRVASSSLLVAGCVLLASTDVGAQQASGVDAERRASATLLWTQAWELKDSGDLDGACEKFLTVVRLVPSGSAHIQAGACHERAGRIASAWSAYKTAGTASEGELDATKRAALQRDATQGVERTEAELSWLTLFVDGPTPLPPSLVIERNGVEVPAGILGESLPSDAGSIEIVVRAQGFETSTRTVVLERRAKLEQRFELVRLPAARPEGSAATKTPRAATARDLDRVPPPGVTPGSSVPTWAWGVGGAGVLLSGVGIGFLVDDLDAVSDLEANCGAAPKSDGRFHCARSPEDDMARQERSLGLAIGFGAVGGAALAASVLGIVLDGGGAAPSTDAWLTPWVGLHAAGVVAGETF